MVSAESTLKFSPRIGTDGSYTEVSQDTPVFPPQDSESLGDRVTYSWFKDLTSRMSLLEANAKTSKDESSQPKAGVTEAPDAYMFRTIPEVRDCNWQQFKNRFPDEKGIYAIEALLGSRSLDAEMEFEQLKRLTPQKELEVLAARKKSSQPQHRDFGPRRLERVRINSAFVLAILAKVTGEKWVEKPHTFLRPFKTLVHYHNKMEAVYRELGDRLSRKDEKTGTIRILEDTDQDENETRIAGTATKNSPSTISSMRQESGKVSTASIWDALAADLDKEAVLTEEASQKAFEDITCYIDFVRTQLMPIYTMFDHVDLSKPTQVRYYDLWSLFRVGELVLLRSTHKSDDRSGRWETRPSGSQKPTEAPQTVTAEPLVGRVFWFRAEEPDWDIDDLSETGSGGRLRRDKDPDDSKPFKDTSIGFYYIDHDGEEYRAVDQFLSIKGFSGERDVTLLPVSPLRFSRDQKQILQDLQARGAKFQAIVGQSSHANLAYQGWTLTRTPLDDPMEEQKGVSLSIPIHVDSDIIVDFREAYNSRPWWKPSFTRFEKHNYMARTTEDRFSIIRWGDKDRTKAVRRDGEVVIYDDAVHNQESDHFLDSVAGRYLVGPGHRTPSHIIAGNDPYEEDLVLLPSRVFAYALRERKFINANLRYIKRNPSLDASNAFDKLRISEKHKLLIQSVIFEHFEKKEAQKQGIAKDLEISDQDFIRGKGRGVVILLHGAPGVGKTATAEAVSYAYNKPLFPITCGNLGIEPKAVEDNLTELFRLANLWDCILLLDEAEIFLSPREKRDHNLQRNALVSGTSFSKAWFPHCLPRCFLSALTLLVSVFLRILEYYSGVLFLTTNRSGALDEAIKSRVHLSLLYPHLGRRETMSLFKMNIDRLIQIEKETAKITGQQELTIEENGIMDFAETHYHKFEEREDSRWNGRQIRNAFQIAASLARYQSHHHTQRGHYVGAKHFQEVEDATLEYDEFRYRTAMKTDGELAFTRGDRGPDLPQPQPAAPDWHSHQRRQTNYPRFEATASPQLNRNWASSPNVHSSSRGGGVARDGRGDYGGSPSWSPSSGGPSTPTPNLAQRPSLSPHGSMRTEGGGDKSWDQRHRSPEAAGYPPGENIYD